MDPLTDALETIHLWTWISPEPQALGPEGMSHRPGETSSPEPAEHPSTRRGRSPRPAGGFYIVTAGACRLEIDGFDDPMNLSSGDTAVMPRACAHRLIPTADAGTITSVLGGRFSFEEPRHGSLLTGLPPVILLEGADGTPRSWLTDVLDIVSEEMTADLPGAQAVINRCGHILFAQAVRAHVASLRNQNGSVAALLDPDVGPALSLMHGQPEERWTVASLAARVAMSRSAFAARFAAVAGKTPVEYLTNCRMTKASSMLRGGRDGIKQIAARVGYTSQAAFSTAFKRWAGVAPGSYRRQPRTTESREPANAVA